MAQQSPKFEILSEEKTKEMLEVFKGERTGWVLVDSEKWFFPYRYIEQGSGFYNFKARPDDTWVISYPRSGTTLMQELVWLLSNNLDFETAKKQLLTERFRFLEFSLFHHPEVTKEFLELNKDDETKQQFCRELAKPGYEVIESIPSPRFIKSHFPFRLLPGILDVGCKIVYIARNPKNVAVSWYNLNRTIKTQGFESDFATFWDYFENNLVPWSPYWIHLKDAWALKDHPNLLFVFYEDIKHNIRKVIREIATFLNKMYTDQQIENLVDHLDIKNFRDNPMVNYKELNDCKIIKPESFIRHGFSSGWKDSFFPELNVRADEWIQENLQDTDLRFPLFDDVNKN